MNEEKSPLVLMVEDEEDVLRINARILRRRGCRVLTAASCAEAYALLSDHEPELLILDVMLPDGSGFDICRRVRSVSEVPVIFLTGKTDISDKVEGLGSGGDYYLTKPYDPDELIAVSTRLVKRQRDTGLIKKGSLRLDIPRARASIDGLDAGLTATEFALLLTLVRNEGRELSPQALYEAVWDAPSADDVRTVRTHIKNLRRKIGADDAADFDIVSAYGKGYTFTTLR